MAEKHVLAIDQQAFDHISSAMIRHLHELNEELTPAYPDAPDAAFTLAIGHALDITLNSFGDLEAKASVVTAINNALALGKQPWRLMPVA